VEQTAATEPHLILLGCSPVVLQLEQLPVVVAVVQETLERAVQGELVAVVQGRTQGVLVQTAPSTDPVVVEVVVETLVLVVTVIKELL
jgi:hypothetical protein